MKRIGIWVVGAALLLSSCDTYTGQGAAVGGTFGSILGSAIGGIAGGWRGSDIGTIVGMAGGAAVGAAIGAQADKAEAEKYAAYKRDREQRVRLGMTMMMITNHRAAMTTVALMIRTAVTTVSISESLVLKDRSQKSSMLLRVMLLLLLRRMPLRSF